MATSAPLPQAQEPNGLDVLEDFLVRHPGQITKRFLQWRHKYGLKQIALSPDEVTKYTRLIIGDFTYNSGDEWPPYLLKVTGDVTIKNPSMRSLGHLREVGGTLSIVGTNVDNLGDLHTVTSIDLSNSCVTSWGVLKNAGDIRLSKGQTELIDAFVGSEMRVTGKAYIGAQELSLIRDSDGLVERSGRLMPMPGPISLM